MPRCKYEVLRSLTKEDFKITNQRETMLQSISEKIKEKFSKSFL